jgi:4-amino-4-deoxy-L-arabinose transferase-like glycosyltransferase
VRRNFESMKIRVAWLTRLSHPLSSGGCVPVLALVGVLALRLVYVLYFVPNAIPYWRDGFSYDNIARNVIAGNGYWDKTGEWPNEPPFANPFAPTARWLPGYPLFIAGVYVLFGDTYRAVYVTQAFLGVVIAGLTYLSAKHVLEDKAALVALLLYAFDPFAVSITGQIQTETLFTALMMASFFCFIRSWQVTGTPLIFACMSGLWAGAATLTRSVGAPMFTGLCFAHLLGWGETFARIGIATRVRTITIASIVFVGSLLPWLIRNNETTGQYVFSTQGWQALAMSSNDNADTHYTLEGMNSIPVTSIEQPEIEREGIYRAFAMNWIRDHPVRFASLYVSRVFSFWSPFLATYAGTVAIVGALFNGALLLFGGISVIAFRKTWRRFLSIYAVLLTFTFSYSVGAIATRYRLPLYPLLEILAAGGILIVTASMRMQARRLAVHAFHSQQ